MANQTETAIPHVGCKTYSECHREQICFDPWHCSAEVSRTEKPTETAAWKSGDRIDFGNGGSVIVHWANEEQIGFSIDHPKWDEPRLVRMTHADFAGSLVETREKITNG